MLDTGHKIMDLFNIVHKNIETKIISQFPSRICPRGTQVPHYITLQGEGKKYQW